VAFTIAREAWQAWRRYDAALFGIVQGNQTPERLDPTYGRLPTSAMRLALTLAAVDWALQGGSARSGSAACDDGLGAFGALRGGGSVGSARGRGGSGGSGVGGDGGPRAQVTLGHWAAAQEIAERWRVHAHQVLARALRDEEDDEAATAAGRLVLYLGKVGGQHKRADLQRGLNLTAVELDAAIAAAGPRLRTWEEKTRGQPARWVGLATDAPGAPGAPAAPAGVGAPVALAPMPAAERPAHGEALHGSGIRIPTTEGTEGPYQESSAGTSVVTATTEVVVGPPVPAAGDADGAQGPGSRPGAVSDVAAPDVGTPARPAGPAGMEVRVL
jgi:hypothetical protein